MWYIMKLQKASVGKYKDKHRYKWMLVVPPGIIEELGLKKGDVLEAKAVDGKLVYSKK